MRAVDVLLAVASAAAVTVAVAVSPESPPPGALLAAATLGLTLGAALLVRRRWPVAVLIGSLVAVLTYDSTGYPGIAPLWPLLVPLYTVARAGRLLTGAVVGATAMLIGAGWVLHAGVPVLELLDGMVREIAVYALALVAGAAVRTRDRFAAEFTARLAAERRQQEREAEQRVLTERLRIARELHDVTAHTVAVVGIQIALAKELIDRDPAAARDLLEGTRKINVDAIGELQATVTLLREADAEEPRRSPPDESQIDELVRRAADSGLRVELIRSGVTDPLPPAVGLTAYRIVQEALTNVLRHADAASAHVVLDRAADGLTVTVTDDGRGCDADSWGHGLTGMRERALSLGGALSAGRPEAGGFRVQAWLPTEAAVAEVAQSEPALSESALSESALSESALSEVAE
ncbi:sensor histidine kinase [Cryptosporangium aurantiacum]|uniref:histidine kinase n=1 Tax=Cryptosporangium aurantiacum TaxID=134849 RepID=A0A1M7RAZ8_9ACTN|nr:sensor histidine kinase [Cryptosporangium aurantiacum]SHN43309.1 Signal transduction histidine kinase [Cryptosporangium aurantiacum]